jgi:hypothetical protein
MRARACLQVEVNPVCQQLKLRGYCAEKGIHVQAFSPLGGQSWAAERNAVLESEVLAEIAKARGKTVAQVFILTTTHSCCLCTPDGRPSVDDVFGLMLRVMDLLSSPFIRCR